MEILATFSSNNICHKSNFLFSFNFQVSIAIRILDLLISRADPALGSLCGHFLAIFDNFWPLKKINLLEEFLKGFFAKQCFDIFNTGCE